MPRWLPIIVVSAFLFGCQGAGQPEAKAEAREFPAESQTELTACTGERPEACIQIYKPVCAQVSAKGCSGGDCAVSWKTYGNSCTACADTKVEGYIKGACE